MRGDRLLSLSASAELPLSECHERMGCNALSWLQQEFSALPTTSSELSAHSLSIIRPKKLDNASPTSHDCSSDRAGADKCVPQAEEDYLT
jgi:hypothetical protein